MIHLVLDLETLCTGRNPGVVLEIAALIFDDTQPIDTQPLPGFTTHPGLAEQLAAGLIIDSKVLAWWNHSDRRDQFLDILRRGGPNHRAHGLLTNCCQQYKPSYVWTRGTDFDLPILANFFRALGESDPLENLRSLDIRTANLAVGAKPPHTHSALEDCRADLPIIAAFLKKCPSHV